ncbi:MAG: type II toxin-antitoxin system RelE/ParE family toxin [Chloroflexi bacterium]|nr:type II toxin-antitoxin system RelE/ParE family toxin [Chloroflexota bacterium]
MFRPRAQRQLHRLQSSVVLGLARAIDALAENPRPQGVDKLEGVQFWRIRVGDYRVVYGIDDNARIVTVVRVAHRREAYRGL